MTEMQKRYKGNKIWILIIALFLIAMLLIYIMFSQIFNDLKSAGGKNADENLKETSIHLFQKVSDVSFIAEDGSQINPLAGGEGVKIFLFWASWCPHCIESVKAADELRTAARNMDAEFYLVNKLDYEKETKEQALQFIKDNQIQTESCFDEECKAYHSMGLNMIPTLLVLDHKNRVISMAEGHVPSVSQLEHMITEAKNGKSDTMKAAIKEQMTDEEGAFRTTYSMERSKLPSGSDVLSESLGIMLESAALSFDREGFLQIWNYSKKNMFPEGLMPWVISGDTDTQVNALIDDFRILGAMQEILEQENGLLSDYEAYRDAVYTYNTQEGRPVDFYDRQYQQKAGRFTLCYGDLKVLSVLKEEDRRFEEVYDHTLEIILNGKISERFPLYYSYYDYEEERYKGTVLNMSEALTTLLHLSEAGKLPEEALKWLEQEMEKGCIYAVYDREGNPSEDGYYESTAVYALTVMIALSEDREDLAGKAMNRMEQFRIHEDANERNGLFGNSDGTGIYSFDQGMALLAYTAYERYTQ